MIAFNSKALSFALLILVGAITVVEAQNLHSTEQYKIEYKQELFETRGVYKTHLENNFESSKNINLECNPRTHDHYGMMINDLVEDVCGKVYGYNFSDEEDIAWSTQELEIDQIHELDKNELVINLILHIT